MEWPLRPNGGSATIAIWYVAGAAIVLVETLSVSIYFSRFRFEHSVV